MPTGGGIGGATGVGAGVGAASGAGVLAREIRICRDADADAVGVAAPGGGGAISVAGANPEWTGAGIAAPTSWRASAFNWAERSTPHVGQANVTGWRTMSGVASIAYFAPQSQMIFISSQGFGFNKTIFVAKGNAMGVIHLVERALPSQNKKFPPYL